MVVLPWLQEDAHKWQIFLGNRVAQIHSILGRESWYYVKSSENPADVASRGIRPVILRNHTLWWEGPSWLKDKTIQYRPTQVDKTDLEMKTVTVHSALPQEVNQIWELLLQRYSSLSKLQRVTAYIKRYLHNLRSKKEDRKTGYLNTTELRDALTTLIKTTQGQHFSEEINQLLKNEALSKKSRLFSLSPFIDNDGVLRVIGRLEQSDLPYERKHPIILPYKSDLTTLVMNMFHKATLHGGNTLTLEAIRQQFWILNGLKTVKGFIHQCVKCHRNKSQMAQQMMGMLPRERVIITPPFSHTGVDYAGPFDLLIARGRGNRTRKGYISIFICLTTKAIHLEVVTDLTSQAFIAALRRFVSRRGPVSHMYSDNATNFVGASKILNDLHSQEVFKNEVYNAVQDLGTQWHFIPPASPHFGGLWEAGVKAVKHHMRRVIGDTRLTYEEMCTLMAQIEACLNSRPLCPLSENPESLEVLTPGHFLTGAPLITVPSKGDLEKNPNLLDRWQRTERMYQNFWKKWSSEYISRLQQRPKWAQRQPNLKVGNLVLIKDEHLPPTKWALGRVIETHPGSDGLTRVVTLQTKGSKIKRSITKVSLLPITDNYMEESVDIETLTATFSQQEKSDTIQQGTSDRNEDTPQGICTAPAAHLDKERNKHSKRNRARHSEKNEETKRRKTHVNTQHGFLSNTLLSLLIIMLSAIIVLGQPDIEAPYSLTKFDKHEGIYFEDISEIQLYSSEWNIIIYYDLTTYWKEFTGIRKTIFRLTQLCRQNTKLTMPGELCNGTLIQLQHQFAESEQINEILYQQNESGMYRSKRAPLEVIGSIANGLFGILDQDFADKYERQISDIKENEDLLRELLRNQTTITENTINIVKKTNERINHQLELFENHIQSISDGFNKAEEELKTTQIFNSAVTLVALNLINFQHMQRELLDVITDTKHGRINTLLLTPNQLKDQLTIIRNHLPQDLRIPGTGSRTSMLPIYKIMHVKMRITQKRALFDVRIPLVSTEAYRLYNLIPIPTIQEDSFVYLVPSTQYLAVNIHKDRYTPLTRDEIRDCMILSDTLLICNLKQPIYSLQSTQNKCEIDLLNHERELSSFCRFRKTPKTKVWQKLHSSSTWIFVMDKNTSVDIVCNTVSRTITLIGSGIIQLKPNCMVKHPTLFINSNNQQPSTLNSSFIPEINIITNHFDKFMVQNKSGNTSNLASELHIEREINYKELEELQVAVNQQQQHISKIHTLHYHDLHHYVGLYCLAAGLIGWISYYLWRKHKGNVRFQFDQPHPAPRTLTHRTVNLELPTLNSSRRENVQDITE